MVHIYTFSLPPIATTMLDDFVEAAELQQCCSTFCAQGPKAPPPPHWTDLTLTLFSLSHITLFMLTFSAHTHHSFSWSLAAVRLDFLVLFAHILCKSSPVLSKSFSSYKFPQYILQRCHNSTLPIHTKMEIWKLLPHDCIPEMKMQW